VERFYAAQAPKVFRAAYRITGSAADAEDVVQGVFLRLLQRSDVPLGDGGAGYLYRSTVHGALDLLRSRQRAAWVPLEEPDGAADPAPGPEREEDLRRLRRALRSALSRLSPRAAEIFALRYFEGLGNREIAELVGTSQGVVAVLLHRTRARLRKELGALLGDRS
jgi:RNA polymerase sigma-70 factor (ECF subfamily)